MTETSFSVMQTILAVIGTVADAVCFYWLISCYVRKRSKAIWWPVIYLVVSAIGLFIPAISLMGFLIVIILVTVLGKHIELGMLASSWLSITYFGIYDQYPIFLMLIPLISVLFAVGTLLTVRFYTGFLQLQQEREQFFVQSQQVQAIHDRMEEVENFYSGIRKLKHEMRGHLNNISGLIESRQYKYYGAIDISTENNIFSVAVMLQGKE